MASETNISETANLSRQKPKDGVGPLYHRVYTISVPASWPRAKEAMRRFQSDINHYSPQLMCRFEKTCGHEKTLAVGDEFQIHITGPWNGPVRVKEVSETAFTLATLEGHMEAGEIRFSIRQVDDINIEFKIESIARSHDLIVDFVYDKVPIAKFAQTEMWKSVCEAMAKDIGGTEVLSSESQTKVLTERRDEETGAWELL